MVKCTDCKFMKKRDNIYICGIVFPKWMSSNTSTRTYPNFGCDLGQPKQKEDISDYIVLNEYNPGEYDGFI